MHQQHTSAVAMAKHPPPPPHQKRPKPTTVRRRAPKTTPEEPIQNYLAHIILLVRGLIRCCGFDIFGCGFRIGFMTVVSFALTVLAQPIMFYTIWSRDREIMMRACTLIGHMGQAMAKAFNAYHHRQQMVNAMHYLRTLYGRNNAATNGNAAILRKWGRRFWTMARGVTIVTICMCPAFFVYPLLKTGTLLDPHEMVLPMYLPWVDETTRSGAAGLLCLHMACLFMGTVGILGADLVFWIQILHICPIVEMLINVLRRLDARVVRNENDYDGSAPTEHRWLTMEKSLDNIVELHNELIGYMNKLANMYEFNNLAEIFSNAMSICLTMFVHYFIDYAPLYIFVLIVFIKLMVICALGTIVEIYYDQMYSAIEQCHWYLMNISMQKKFILLLLQAQKPTYLLAGSSVVNMQLFVSVMKTIYSVAMLLNKMEL